MSFEAILTALADPTRRAILDRMRGGRLPVGQIAAPLPVSRPAVSQHLKVLVEAGLVTMVKDGRRNLYGLTPGGAVPLVEWLGALSTVVPAEVSTGSSRTLNVRLSLDETWQLFCEDVALWWPVSVVSMSAQSDGALPQAVILDAREGGLWQEILYDGTTGIWGHVVSADIGDRLVLDWRLGTPDGSRVVVQFQPEAGGTRVTVNHDADTPDMAEMWDLVLLQRFGAAAASSLSNF